MPWKVEILQIDVHSIHFGDNKSITQKGRVDFKSIVSELIVVQTRLIGELEDMTALAS